jgi:hypothetical protein
MRRCEIVAGAVLMALLASTAGASIYVAADLSELVAEASAVVHGRVRSTEAHWLEGRTGIETIVTLDIDESFKGSLGDSISLRVPGGRMGPYRSILVGAPTLREGDEVVLFLAGGGPAVPHLVGLAQGVFRVVVDQDSGRRSVVPEIGPSGASAGAVRLVRGDPSRRPVSIEAFGARVRELAR